MRRYRFLEVALLACAWLAPDAQAQSTCPSRLFASGWESTVHVYDACSGQYLRDLDTRTRLPGAMAVRLGPDGLLYVVAEGTGIVHKYRNDTLEYVGKFATVGPIGATGLAFAADGSAYVAGYQTSEVWHYDRAGNALGIAVPARTAGLRGPDNGMTFGPDGNLYIPGYDSSNVVRFDPRAGQASVAVAARTAGLINTRGLLPARDGQGMFITSEGSGALLRWNLASGSVTPLAAGFDSPRGIDYAPDGKLLVSDGDSVVRIDPDTGARLGTLVPMGSGGVAALVFVAVIARPPLATAVDASQVGSQFWIVGDAAFTGRVLDLQSALTATGAVFGPDLRFSDLALKRWGSVRMELVSCNEARFTWDSTGADSARFGTGGYEVFRYFENEATDRCRAQGVDGPDKSWVNGQWWGRDARAGEGWFVDRRADGATFFAWFTHRPAPGATVDASQVGTQYWVVGDARLDGRVLQLDSVLSATGATFGAVLRFADLALKRWGSVRIELVSCTEAVFSWDSTLATSAGFGSGTYPVYRYFENEDTARCRDRGLDHPDKSWINGQWWGRDARAGEGLFLDRASDGTTFFAWFTHRPR